MLISALGIEAYDYFENGFLFSDSEDLFFYILAFSILILIISLIQYFAIYQYAFNSDYLWKDKMSKK